MGYSIFCEHFSKDRLLFDAPMSEYTSFKIGGPADLMVMPVNSEEVQKAVDLCKASGLPYFVMGKGSNLLVKDSGVRGVIINLSKYLESYEFIDDLTLKAGAGITLAKLAGIAADKGLEGLEFASGIPGSLGGAVYMNAGAYDFEMKDVLVSATVLCGDGREKIMDTNDMALGYRSSVFQKSAHIILDATVKLMLGDKDKIREKMLELNGRRKEKQPLDLPSGGSTFKRPEGHFASKLIDDCGLKGFSIGGAKVSEKHAGFVVNYNQATACDVIAVMDHVREKVFKEFGVTLVAEIEII